MPAADPRHYVRGQYEGYADVPGVAPGPDTETFAALRLEIDDWRSTCRSSPGSVARHCHSA
jgi:glucose-6-phosphate 1-dehydrogenase